MPYPSGSELAQEILRLGDFTNERFRSTDTVLKETASHVGGLSTLLIEKGIITDSELDESIAEMRRFIDEKVAEDKDAPGASKLG